MVDSWRVVSFKLISSLSVFLFRYELARIVLQLKLTNSEQIATKATAIKYNPVNTSVICFVGQLTFSLCLGNINYVNVSKLHLINPYVA